MERPRVFRVAGAVAVMVVGAALPAFAGTSLDQVVVSATRTERAVVDAPVRVEVVTAAELARTHARTLKEALENVVGLQLREIHGKSGYEAALQGLGGDQVLVLVDGLPMSASTGSTVDVTQLALAEVERIEVIKGATSAQYGSAAMGGVINVITRPLAAGWRAEVLLDGGSYGEQNPSAEVLAPARRHGRLLAEGGNERWRVRAALDQLDSDGFDPDPASWPRPGDAFRRQQFDTRAEWHGSGGQRLFAGAARYDEQLHSRYQLRLPGGSSDQRKEEQVRRTRLTAGGRLPLALGDWQWSALHERFDNDTLKFAGSTRFDDREAALGLDHVSSQLALPPGPRQEWVLGFDLRRETLAQFKDGVSELDSGNEVDRESGEIFVQSTFYQSAGQEWLLGVRHQRDSDFGGHSAGKLGWRWHAFDTAHWRGTVRAGVGQGYRVPNLKERYYLFDHSQLGYVVIGNPDLQPEEAVSYQLGVTLSRAPGITAELGLYWNTLRNLIQVDTDNPGTGPGGVSEFRYQNIGTARTWGLESGLTWQMAPRWRVEAGYTWLNAENRDDGSDLTRRPAHQLRLSLDHDLGARTTVSVRARGQSDELVSTATGERSPAWGLLDLKVNHRLSDALTLFAGVDNLTATQRDFAEPTDFSPLAGRFVYLGARYQLKGKTP